MLSLRELAAKKLTITIPIHSDPKRKFRIFKEEIRKIEKFHRLCQIRRLVKIQLLQQLEKEYIKQFAISDNYYPNARQQSLFFRLINNTFFNIKVPRTCLKGGIKTRIRPRIQLELIRLVLLYYPTYATHTRPKKNNFTYNRTPLQLAVINNNKYIVKMLLQSGAGESINSKEGHMLSTPLLLCTVFLKDNLYKKRKYPEDVLIASTCPLYSGHTSTITPYQVSGSDSIQILEMLIEAGADPNIQDYDNKTPLFYACSSSYLYFVEILLKAGADPNKLSKSGNIIYETPLNIVLEYAYDDDNDDDENIKIINIVKQLLKAGANPMISDTLFHRIPLHHAASGGNLEIVKILLDNDSDVNSKDIDGESPLSMVLEQILHSNSSNRILKYEEILNLLLKHGAKR